MVVEELVNRVDTTDVISETKVSIKKSKDIPKKVVLNLV